MEAQLWLYRSAERSGAFKRNVWASFSCLSRDGALRQLPSLLQLLFLQKGLEPVEWIGAASAHTVAVAGPRPLLTVVYQT